MDMLKRRLVATPQHVPRTMPALLSVLGFPDDYCFAADKWRDRRHTVFMLRENHSFWERHPDLNILASDVREQYRKRVKEVRPDLDENKVVGQILIGSFARIKKILGKRGVSL